LAGRDALNATPADASAAGTSARVALLLAGAMTVVPFLLPEHRLPVRSFYDEWLAFALGGAALAAGAVALRGRTASIPELAVWLAGFAAWLGVQAALRSPAYWQLPAAGIVFLLFAGALVSLGAWLRDALGAERAVDTLAAFLLAGASLNALIGVVQFYGVPAALDGLVATPTGARSVGHVAQANVFAMYVAVGEASLVYLFVRRRLSAPIALFLGALLVVGAAYAQSRSGLLFAIWMVAAAWALGRRNESTARAVRKATVLLAGASVIVMLALPVVHEWLGISGRYISGLGRLVAPDVVGSESRPAAWALALGLFAGAPWLGVGWGEFAGAAFERGLPRVMAAYEEIWSSPHNAVFHILAEGGIVAGLIALAAAGRWWWVALRTLRREGSTTVWWVAGVVGVVCVHAMVEYPLWYAHVLALTALAAGLMPTPAAAVPASTVRAATAAGVVALAGALAWTLGDYLKLERAFLIAKGDTLAVPADVAAAIGALEQLSRGPLGAYAEPWLHRARSPDHAEMAATGERVLRRAPGSPALARHAAALALSGRTDEALRLADHALATLPRARDRFERAIGAAPEGAPDALDPLRERLRATTE
jgi:O-antigen ligase